MNTRVGHPCVNFVAGQRAPTHTWSSIAFLKIMTGSTAAADHLVQPGNDPQVTENDLYGSVGNLMNNPSPTEGGTSLIIENELYETCSGYSRNRHDH
ncbi:uncharacterized protein LOC123517794 isoform X2 [Portunus trituberculatus]|uniref:uncharacterized protein LOC123517794 isoform X2 n=1 Tax=Portunus trituberculatus TaxID=210409 RepID=UPI001E1CE6C1|nr:uncharacterized protein LOC123517794 isoform X2 [Portunus trituberculatus]